MSNAPRSLLDEILCAAVVAGALLVLLVPGARGSAAIGWLPMWLVAMPAAAWWAARGFPLPQRAAVTAPARTMRARPVRPQARRSARVARRAAERRAA